MVWKALGLAFAIAFVAGLVFSACYDERPLRGQAPAAAVLGN